MTQSRQICRRQHYVPQFYLRNFASPMFSSSLDTYYFNSHRWEHRSPSGVGWAAHLCSMIGDDGTRTDKFDQFFKLTVEDPAAPVLRKMATGKRASTNYEQSVFALFVALTAARNPVLFRDVMDSHVAKQVAAPNKSRLDELVRKWCEAVGRKFDPNRSFVEFFMPSGLGGIWRWACRFQALLLSCRWKYVTTTAENPFITTDCPVFKEWDRRQGVRLVGFPISSIAAVLFLSGHGHEFRSGTVNHAQAFNRQTLDKATEFVISSRQTFACHELLATWPRRFPQT